MLVSPGLRGYDFRDPWVGTNFAAMIVALGQQTLNGAVEVFLHMWVDGPYRKPQEVDFLVRERVREMVTRAFPLSRLAPNCKGLEPPAIGRLSEVHHVGHTLVMEKADEFNRMVGEFLLG